ncbi:MAG: hypothetical protein WAL02_05190, partial [Rhodoplanes sp.]
DWIRHEQAETILLNQSLGGPSARPLAKLLRAIERALAAQGKTPEQATLAEMDALWDEAKRAERSEVVISSGGQSS